MTLKTRSAAAPFRTETVWNAGLSGTGAAGEGRSLTVGHEGDWVPEHLVLLAAESCFMSTLLALAADAGVRVLGYVSSGHLLASDEAAPLWVVLSPCVVVGSASDAERITTLGEQATRESIVARLLGDRLRLALDVQIIAPTTPG
jgi:organic hydroperoxide reductase OsmC/OhrA